MLSIDLDGPCTGNNRLGLDCRFQAISVRTLGPWLTGLQCGGARAAQTRGPWSSDACLHRTTPSVRPLTPSGLPIDLPASRSARS